MVRIRQSSGKKSCNSFKLLIFAKHLSNASSRNCGANGFCVKLIDLKVAHRVISVAGY